MEICLRFPIMYIISKIEYKKRGSQTPTVGLNSWNEKKYHWVHQTRLIKMLECMNPKHSTPETMNGDQRKGITHDEFS